MRNNISTATERINVRATEPIVVPADNARVSRVLRWRRVQGAGGLLLAASFFMPVVDGCSSPIVPAAEVWDYLESANFDVLGIAGCFVLYLAAHLFGVFTLITTARGRRYDARIERTLGRSVLWLLGVLILAHITAFVIEMLQPRVLWPPVGAFGAVVGYSVLFWIQCLRTGERGLLAARWYAACCAVAWFGTITASNLLTGDPVYYGLWSSLLGSGAILVGMTTEAKVRSFADWTPTVGRLLICRLETVPLDEPRCEKCGYLLIGLTVPRCPECGRPFEP